MKRQLLRFASKTIELRMTSDDFSDLMEENLNWLDDDNKTFYKNPLNELDYHRYESEFIISRNSKRDIQWPSIYFLFTIIHAKIIKNEPTLKIHFSSGIPLNYIVGYVSCFLFFWFLSFPLRLIIYVASIVLLFMLFFLIIRSKIDLKIFIKELTNN